MLNLRNRENAMNMAKAIETVYNYFGTKIFTNAQYNSMRDDCASVQKWDRRTRKNYYQSVQPTLQTLVNANVIFVAKVENYKKAYFETHWGEREWIPADEYSEAMELFVKNDDNVVINTMREKMEEEIQCMDCVRHYYKLKYYSLKEYIEAEMPWLVVILSNGEI